MKKRRFLILCAVLLLALVVLFYPRNYGNVSTVLRTVDDSDVYTKEEIQQAMDVAEGYFRDNFENCKLLTLEYDGKWRADELYRANQYGMAPDQVIILKSSFYVPAKGAESSLNPDSTYTNWKWILVREDGEKWTHKDHGYG